MIRKFDTLYQVAFFEKVFPVNCYLVEEEDGLTLIDAALPNSAKTIVQAAKTLNKPITRIVLTHAHGDHVGALDELKKLYPHVPVFISIRDAKLLKGDRSLEADEPQTPIKGGVPKNIQTTPDVLLKAGDQVGSLVAIPSPGHTPGSMSFLDKRNNILIAGDAFQTRGGTAVSGQLRPFFPFPAMATWNKIKALESAQQLLKSQPKLLAVGHGKVLETPMEEMKKAIHDAKQKLNYPEA
ncbi:MBL fold metallo-hydrolase [Bacillaceae bacterium S4-13-58]